MIYFSFSAFITSAVDLTHCRSIPRAWHEVSRPDAQPCQGRFHYHFLLGVSCGHFRQLSPPPPLRVCLQSSVQLNRRVISELAITEPRTFLSLAKLAQGRREEGFLAALGDGKEPDGVFSRIPLSR